MSRTLLILTAERSRRRAVQSLCSEYLDRMTYYNLRASIAECTVAFAGTIPRTIDKQAFHLLRRLESDDYVILLDERGKNHSSERFAELLETLFQWNKRIVFIIGGAYGVNEQVRQRANDLLSLGPLTLSHEIARIVLCEQLYRAMTILHGEPYHHGSTDE